MTATENQGSGIWITNHASRRLMLCLYEGSPLADKDALNSLMTCVTSTVSHTKRIQIHHYIKLAQTMASQITYSDTVTYITF